MVYDIVVIGIILYFLFAILASLLVAIVLILFKLFHKNFAVKICKCIILWLLIPFILPFKTKKWEVINRKVYAWLLALFSPFFISVFFIVIFVLNLNKPLHYEELSFTSREEIAAITEIEDFPEFEYINNTRDGMDDITWIRNKFKDEEKVMQLIAKIESKLAEQENVFWIKDTIGDSESKAFFGTDIVYVCKRGWDALLMEKPKDIEEGYSLVTIAVGKKAFVITYEGSYIFNEEYYSNPDSLSKRIGIAFPEYKVVNVLGCPIWISQDPAWSMTLKLDRKPSKAFIQAIENAEHWEKLDDGRYCFEDDGLSVIVNPKNRIVEMSIW